MAKVRFEKGSWNWKMFGEFYILCQDYWEPEDTDQWWEELDRATREFTQKYDNGIFPRKLCCALVSYLEEKSRRNKK